MKKKYIKSILSALAVGAIALGVQSCSSGVKENLVYITPDASDDGEGTEASPISFTKAVINAKAGDALVLKGGTYSYSTRIGLFNNGSPNEEIKIRPQSESDEVIFDFSSMEFDGTNRGIQIYGDFWHISNISVTGAGDNGMYIAGSYNTVENSLFYNNRDTGLQLGRAYSSDSSIDSWPSYNLIKNCTSFANYDAETYGENADGFAAKLTIGYGNVFDGCIAFRNSDDGWDLFAKEDSGNIGTVMLYNCVSFENGFLPYQIDRTDSSGNTYKSYNTMNGDGIGFKLGGSTMEGDVIIDNCLAFNNKLHGFGDNSNPGVISIKNSSAINNCMGLTTDGNVGERGIEGTTNKSNNFDLARDTNSYNNYYGLLSYVNNQKNYAASSDNSYNADAFRGSTAYSIFNTTYENGAEVYKAFTNYTDASVYSSNDTDVSLDPGTTYTGLSDSSFASVAAVNAKCGSVDDLHTLADFHNTLRNDDASVNMGDTWKITDSTLLTYADGKAIGHNLSLDSDSAYPHYETSYFSGCTTREDVMVASAYSVLEVTADLNAVYQDFEIAKRIHGCEIEWTSSNEDIITIDTYEEVSFSNSVYIQGLVICPSEDTSVTLTAVITCGESSKTKEFTLNVKSRNQSMGSLVNTGSSTIKVTQYDQYVVPTIYATDSSSNTLSALSPNLYTLNYKYEFATDRNSRYYDVGGVYTAVSGVYRVTATATSLVERDNGKTATLVYYVYILDKDCDIDFIGGDSSFALNNNGFTISGELSNILGTLYAVVSDTELSLDADGLINHPDVQKYDISEDTISAEFLSDNNTATGYYIYYVVSNMNKSKTSTVYSTNVTVKNVETNEQFYEIATQAKLNDESGGNTTIYSLVNDLDFTGFTWTPVSGQTFSGLFNGNGNKISNITINASGTKNVNVFYKVQNGTIMNVVFENISITNTNETGKQVGIIGELQGGYIADVTARNITAIGYQGIGGIIGAISGGKNYITRCTLDNRASDTAVITAKLGKYAGGIVGNAQKNSDQALLETYITDCAVYATIGDGTDAGGNNGGIIGRIKNESSVYTTVIEHCVFVGTVIAKGQYNAGIVGDFDNGAGFVTINYCYSDAKFIYDGETLDARLADVNNEETQTYAHKNSNPIVGRAVLSSGEYETKGNFGTWAEYYSQSISSTAWCFTGYYGPEYVFQASFYQNIMMFDMENTWTYIDGILYLKVSLAE